MYAIRSYYGEDAAVEGPVDAQELLLLLGGAADLEARDRELPFLGEGGLDLIAVRQVLGPAAFGKAAQAPEVAPRIQEQAGGFDHLGWAQGHRLSILRAVFAPFLRESPTELSAGAFQMLGLEGEFAFRISYNFV